MTTKQAIRAAYSEHVRVLLARRRVRTQSALAQLARAEEDLATATAVAIQLVKETA